MEETCDKFLLILIKKYIKNWKTIITKWYFYLYTSGFLYLFYFFNLNQNFLF
jgi:hypothetical protein